MKRSAVTIAIPTLGREQVLLDTLHAVLALQPPAAEVLVIDQTPSHEPATTAQLEAWQRNGQVRWLRRERPSIPAAMNHALTAAQSPIVLYLDDDVIPHTDLIAAHAARYADASVTAVVGQVLQPGQEPERVPLARRGRGRGLRRDLQFPFHGTEGAEVANCMAGNLSVRRETALAIGGFDENFRGAAYRFETDFCRRLRRQGGTMVYEPRASIRHLRAAHGGTRAYGSHLRTARPEHSVGDYYFAWTHGTRTEALGYSLRRLVTELRARYYLRRPWWMPAKLLGELRGWLWASQLCWQGPRLLDAANLGGGA